MYPFFIKSIVDDPLKSERNKTPVNILQCKHLRTASHKVGDRQQKQHTIEFVGCDVVWVYYDLTSRNVEYEMISNNNFEEYKNNSTATLQNVLTD